jgi:hypothetical protein
LSLLFFHFASTSLVVPLLLSWPSFILTCIVLFYPGFHKRGKAFNICFSESGLFYFMWLSPAPSISSNKMYSVDFSQHVQSNAIKFSEPSTHHVCCHFLTPKTLYNVVIRLFRVKSW